MKLKEKNEARKLRKEKGLSVRELSTLLGVSKGTISLWVRDIKLTPKQINKLESKSKSGSLIGSKAGKEKALLKRKKLQEEGRKLIKNADKDFIAGIMLYWAEGAKARTTITFVNSNINMLRFFIDFLKKYFDIKEEDIGFNYQYYSENGFTEKQVRDYWMNGLGLERSKLNKCYVDYRTKSRKGQKKGKTPYGVGRVRIGRVDVIQKIYGAIQEYVGFDNPEWLWCNY